MALKISKTLGKRTFSDYLQVLFGLNLQTFEVIYGYENLKKVLKKLVTFQQL
jgi:hypothetical protein